MSTAGTGGEDWLADYTRRVGDIQRRAEEAQEQIKTLRAQATSQDGAVSVVLAPGGRLEKLDLTPSALELGHQRLAATITRTIQAAHADAAAQTQSAVLPLVGESDAMEFLREQVGTALDDDGDDPDEGDGTAGAGRAAGSEQGQSQAPRQAPPSRPRDDDDDEPFGGSIMR